MKLPFLTRRAEAPTSATAGLRTDVLANAYLCHAPDAAELVARIDGELRRRGVAFSSRGGDPAEDDSRIDAADHFLFVVTPGSLASERCRAELERARDDGKKILFLESGEPADTPPLPGSTDENHVSVAPADFAAGMGAALDRVDQRQRFDAFISYAREDTGFVDELAAALRRAGRKAWLDRADIQAGEDWAKALGFGIASADSFLFVISPDSLASRHCQAEAKNARDLNKLVIPVRCRPVNDDDIGPVLGTTQYVEFKPGDPQGFQPALRKVLDSMDASPELRARLTWLLNRALDWRDSGKEESRLLDGGELRDALGWVDAAGERKLGTPDVIGEYMEASAARDHARRGQARRRRVVVAVLVLGLMASIPAFLASRQKERAITRATESNQAAAQSPDLALLLALESLRIRDTPQGRSALFSILARETRLLAYRRGHAGVVTALAFVRGDTLLAGTDRGDVVAWDSASGAPRMVASAGASADILAASPDRRRLAVAVGDSILIRVADGGAGALLRLPEEEFVTALGWSDDGERLAVGTAEGTLAVWHLPTGSSRPVRQAVGTEDGDVRAVAFDNMGRIAAYTDAGNLLTWSGRTGEEPEPKAVAPGIVMNASFSASGRRLAMVLADSVLVLDLARRTAESIPAPGRQGMRPVAFDPEEKRIAIGEGNGDVRVAALGSRNPPVVLRGHGQEVYALAFTPDGSRLASAGLDRRVALWDLEGTRSFARRIAPPEDGAYATAVAGGADGAALAFTPAADGAAGVVVAGPSGAGKRVFRTRDLHAVSAIRMLSGGRFMSVGEVRSDVTEERDGMPHMYERRDPWLWDGAAPRKVDLGYRPGSETGFSKAALSPDGKLIVMALGTRGVVLREVAHNTILDTLRASGRHGPAQALAFSGDGQRIAAAFIDRTVLIWSVSTGTRVDSLVFPTARPFPAIALDYRGEQLAVGVPEGASVARVATGDSATRRLTGPRYAPRSLAFSPDARMLAATAQEGEVWLFLWEVASGELLGRTAAGPVAPAPTPVDFTADGAALVTGGTTPAIWPVDPAEWRRARAPSWARCRSLRSGPRKPDAVAPHARLADLHSREAKAADRRFRPAARRSGSLPLPTGCASGRPTQSPAPPRRRSPAGARCCRPPAAGRRPRRARR